MDKAEIEERERQKRERKRRRSLKTIEETSSSSSAATAIFPTSPCPTDPGSASGNSASDYPAATESPSSLLPPPPTSKVGSSSSSSSTGKEGFSSRRNCFMIESLLRNDGDDKSRRETCFVGSTIADPHVAATVVQENSPMRPPPPPPLAPMMAAIESARRNVFLAAMLQRFYAFPSKPSAYTSALPTTNRLQVFPHVGFHQPRITNVPVTTTTQPLYYKDQVSPSLYSPSPNSSSGFH